MLQHRFRQAWRWSLLGGFLTALFWFIYYQFNATVPVVETFKLYNWQSFSLPIQLSRWWDVLIVPIHVILLVIIFSLNADKAFFWKGPLIRNSECLIGGLGSGLIVGLIMGLITVLSWQLNFCYLLSLNLALVVYSLWQHFDMNIYDSRKVSKIIAETFFGFFIFSLVLIYGASLVISLFRGLIVGVFFGQALGFVTFWLGVLLLFIFIGVRVISSINFADKLQTIKDNFWRQLELATFYKKPWARFIAWLLDS